MIVCHCHTVTDKEIVGAIVDGAASVEQVGERCGAGTGCGGCVPLLERFLSLADEVVA